MPAWSRAIPNEDHRTHTITCGQTPESPRIRPHLGYSHKNPWKSVLFTSHPTRTLHVHTLIIKVVVDLEVSRQLGGSSPPRWHWSPKSCLAIINVLGFTCGRPYSSGCPPSGGRERKKIPIGERKRKRFFQGWTVQVGSISQGGEYEVEREEGAALGLGLLIKAGAPREPVGDSFDLRYHTCAHRFVSSSNLIRKTPLLLQLKISLYVYFTAIF
ncbi:hypothetical protein OIU76_014741 [Salix suchowensis]|nr:hypothetical protein OIU76_014741 [Salix suchowensis]